MKKRWVLAIDQGTTGSTALLLDHRGRVAARGYAEVPQHFPKPGWVEHDGEEIWASVTHAVRAALEAAGDADGHQVAAVGITNQRETTLLWERKSGKPVARAIVWQDRRTHDRCQQLRRAGLEREIRRATGLVLDPYFSGTKLEWLLRAAPSRLAHAQHGALAFGTIDTWLLWKLTRGGTHATDPTNASRTMLYDIRKKKWSDPLLDRFGVPREVLPEVRPSSGSFGVTRGAGILPDGVPIAGVAGDQQAALFGQGCVEPGESKNTYGTGAFLLLHTGTRAVTSKAGLLTTIACGPGGEIAYALEGSVFIAGAAIQWLRDGLGLVKTAAESEALARSVPDSGGVVMVPAFVGLGAPYWRSDVRGAIFGLTRGTGRAHLVRAALESLAFQSCDLVTAMERDAGVRVRRLRVDGGATANAFLMQLQADLLGVPVERPRVIETTALGAGLLAGLGVGFWESAKEVAHARVVERTFRPARSATWRRGELARWSEAVGRLIGERG
jgi:glycerol kinase